MGLLVGASTGILPARTPICLEWCLLLSWAELNVFNGSVAISILISCNFLKPPRKYLFSLPFTRASINFNIASRPFSDHTLPCFFIRYVYALWELSMDPNLPIFMKPRSCGDFINCQFLAKYCLRVLRLSSSLSVLICDSNVSKITFN